MILVTGATGLLGSQIVRDLVTLNRDVRAIKRSTSNMFYVQDVVDQIEWIDADIEDMASLEEAFVGVDEVIHAAGFVSYHKKDKLKMLNVNYLGTRNIVHLCLEQKVRKLIHISSIAALGSDHMAGQDNHTVDEQFQNKSEEFTSNYGQSKYLGELEVWKAMAEGLSAVILNPSVILGYHNWNQGSSQLFKRVYDGWRYYTMGTTGYVSVNDVSTICIRMMDATIDGERFLVTAENLPIKTIFEYIAKGFSVQAPNKKIDPKYSGMIKFIENIGALLTGKPRLITPETLRMANEQRRYANQKVIACLQYQFEPIDEVCHRICQQYRLKPPPHQK